MFLQSVKLDEWGVIRVKLTPSREIDTDEGAHAFNYCVTHSLERSDIDEIRQISMKDFEDSDDGNEMHYENYVMVIEKDLTYVYDTYALGPFNKRLLRGMHSGVILTQDLVSMLECALVFREQVSPGISP